MNSKKTRRAMILAIICTVLLVFFYYENKHLVVSKYTYVSNKIEKELDGFKIVQISDLHNAKFGTDNKRLIAKIEELNPDIIVITGDLVDSNHTNINRVLKFIDVIVRVCPVYYVTGNHEYWLSKDDFNKLITGLDERGVIILNNECVVISKGEASFNLIGIDDNNLADDTLNNIVKSCGDNFNLILVHEPQYLHDYSNSKADLVLSGHAHGGQIRLPFIGGVVAPGQGFNPKYTEGKYQDGDTTMIVSRGLRNSIIPLRLFNDPEVVYVELKTSFSNAWYD